MKLAICGPGRAGKDECGRWFAEHTPLRYSKSTSQVIAPFAAAHLGLSVEEAFRRRHEDRDLWFKLGCELRRDDPAYLAREVLRDGDLVVGVRDRAEMEATIREGLVSLVIWIDRDVPVDPTLTYGRELADMVIENRWSLADLRRRLDRIARALGLAATECPRPEPSACCPRP
jgi:hypothetical protein